MNITPDFAWNNIKNWTQIGLVHHPEVATLIETDKSLNTYVHAADQALPSVFDPKTVVAAVEASAERMALNDGPNSPISRAIRDARFNIANRGISVTQANTEHYTAQLTDRFADAAERYKTNAALLPAHFTADDLAGFSPEVFTAYRETATAASELHQVRDFLSSLMSVLGDTNNHSYSPVFLLMDPNCPEVFSSIQFTAPASADRIYEAIDPIMAKAVRAGAEFVMSTPAERSEMCRSYELQIEQAEADRNAKTARSVMS